MLNKIENILTCRAVAKVVSNDENICWSKIRLDCRFN